jgi:hypothetical protein
MTHFRQPPRIHLGLCRVDAFGDEIGLVTSKCKMAAVHTLRTPELLNHYLRYPGKNISGWVLKEGNQVRGFALLSIVRQQAFRIGRIADCFLDSLDSDLWHAALHALTNQLIENNADMVVCYGSTHWIAKALKENGFYVLKTSPLLVRDAKKLIPENASFYLTHLEADHAYL